MLNSDYRSFITLAKHLKINLVATSELGLQSGQDKPPPKQQQQPPPKQQQEQPSQKEQQSDQPHQKQQQPEQVPQKQQQLDILPQKQPQSTQVSQKYQQHPENSKLQQPDQIQQQHQVTESPTLKLEPSKLPLNEQNQSNPLIQIQPMPQEQSLLKQPLSQPPKVMQPRITPSHSLKSSHPIISLSKPNVSPIQLSKQPAPAIQVHNLKRKLEIHHLAPQMTITPSGSSQNLTLSPEPEQPAPKSRPAAPVVHPKVLPKGATLFGKLPPQMSLGKLPPQMTLTPSAASIGPRSVMLSQISPQQQKPVEHRLQVVKASKVMSETPNKSTNEGNNVSKLNTLGI